MINITGSILIKYNTIDLSIFIPLKGQTPNECIKALLFMNSNALNVAANYVGKTDHCMLVNPSKRTFLHSCHDFSELCNHINLAVATYLTL